MEVQENNIEQEEIIKSLPELLEEIFELEDNEPSKEDKKKHKEWSNNLLNKHKYYNSRVGFTAFNETKI